MPDIDKLKICIDREECISDGMCVNEGPETFELDDDGKAHVLADWREDRETILEAAASCPLDIIEVVDKDTGEELYPSN